MGMLQNQGVPNVPLPPPQYDQTYMAALNNVLRLFFNNIDAVQQLNLAALNLDLRTLPTDADFNTLRVGDVYRDTKDGTQAGSQMLRVKTDSDTIYLSSVVGSGAVGSVSTTKTISLTGVSGSGAVGVVTP